MFLATVNFGKAKSGEDRAEIKDVAESYLVALLRNGQLCGEHTLGWVRGSLNAYAYLPRPNASAKRFCSGWGKECLTKVSDAFNTPPRWTVLEDEVPKRFPNWTSAPAFYIFTAWPIHQPPVRRMDNGSPIPTYLLPLSDSQKDEVYSWAYTYRNHDLIWTGSGVLQIPAYKQLVEPDSRISLYGREICKVVEKATGIPTFYYLFRYWGRKGEDTSRLCPSCGNKWRVKDSSKLPGSFWDLVFQCKKCRLVSHAACTDDDARHARIGEYTRGKQVRPPSIS